MSGQEVQELKQKVDVERFVRDHLDRVSGGAPQLSARCPGHADERNSLSINTQSGKWTCHAGCGPEHSRDILALIQLIHASSFREALEYLQNYVDEGNVRRAATPGDSFPSETDQPFAHNEDWLEAATERLFINDAWPAFLEKRKIHEKIQMAFRLGVDDRGNLVIPAIDISGEIRGLRFRSEDGSRWWAKNSKASQILYGKLGTSKTVFITEGETDTLALLSQAKNGEASVAGLFGANVAWRSEWTQALRQHETERIVLCGDNDRSGRNMNEETHKLLVEHGCPPERIFRVNWYAVGEELAVDIPEKYDIGEAVRAGLTLEKLGELVEQYPTVESMTEQAVKVATPKQKPAHGDPDLDLAPAAWPPLLGEMRDALYARLPSPDPIIMGGLLATMSHVVGRRVAVMIFGRHVPALYNLSIADTNIGKSAMLDYLTGELYPQLGQMLNLTGTPISSYGLFGSAEGVGKAFTEVADNRIIQVADEYSSQLQKAKSEGGGPVIQAILSLWQGSSQGSIAKGGGWDLTGKHLTIAAATTKIYLHTHMRKEDVMGGYANRFCYWLGFKHQARKALFPQNPDPKTVRDFCEALFEMSQKLGPHAHQPQIQIYPTREAKAVASEWADAFHKRLESMDEVQNLVTTRIPAQVARISALFALLDQSTQVTATHIRRAILVGDYLEQSIWHVFHDYGQSGRTACAAYIIQQIEENNGKLNKRALQQHLPIRFRDDFAWAIADLQRQGILLEENQGRKKFWALAETGE